MSRRTVGAVAQSRGVSRPYQMPAPVGGWNTRDPIGSMSPLDAQVLDNLFPRTGAVELREGSENHISENKVYKTLMEYSYAEGKIFIGAVDDGLYNITASGVGVFMETLTNGYVHYVNFANSAGTQYLWLCNGVDAPLMYTVATGWTNPAITGVIPEDLVYPWVFGRRILAVQKDSMSFWYLPIDSIQGEAEEFDLGPLFTKGGYLMAGAAWTLDGGDGMDDYCVFVTSEGEVAVFQGFDPSSASSFQKIGVFKLPPPMGRRCLKQVGGDLYILTRVGVFPLSRALKSAVINYVDAVSDKIAPSFSDAVTQWGDNEGWEMCVYPDRDALIVNIPQDDTTGQAIQFVMNTKTGAWCSFSNWNAKTFGVFENQLYFGWRVGVRICWIPGLYGDIYRDNQRQTTVIGTCLTSYQQLSRGSMAQPMLFRPILASYSVPELRWGWAVDFGTATVSSIIDQGQPIGIPVWDVAMWDVTPWVAGIQRMKGWQSVACEPGYRHALLLQIAAQYDSVLWSGCDVVVEAGGML